MASPEVRWLKGKRGEEASLVIFLDSNERWDVIFISITVSEKSTSKMYILFLCVGKS